MSYPPLLTELGEQVRRELRSAIRVYDLGDREVRDEVDDGVDRPRSGGVVAHIVDVWVA